MLIAILAGGFALSAIVAVNRGRRVKELEADIVKLLRNLNDANN